MKGQLWTEMQLVKKSSAPEPASTMAPFSLWDCCIRPPAKSGIRAESNTHAFVSQKHRTTGTDVLNIILLFPEVRIIPQDQDPVPGKRVNKISLSKFAKK